MPRLTARKRADLGVFVLLVFIAAFVSILWKVDLIISVFLYLGIPAFYLCIREHKNYKKILLGSLVVGVLLGMAYNLVAEYSNAYATHYSLFPFSHILLGKTPFGDFIWGFLILFCSITFYEHFLDDERNKRLSSWWVFGLGLGLVSFFLTVSLFANNPEGLNAKYAYLILGIMSIVPLGLLLFAKPILLYKMLWLGVFFFILNFVFEISALQLNQWWYPGNYIGMIQILAVQFPLEELLFWIILATPSLILCYEFLIDDGE